MDGNLLEKKFDLLFQTFTERSATGSPCCLVRQDEQHIIRLWGNHGDWHKGNILYSSFCSSLLSPTHSEYVLRTLSSSAGAQRTRHLSQPVLCCHCECWGDRRCCPGRDPGSALTVMPTFAFVPCFLFQSGQG